MATVKDNDSQLPGESSAQTTQGDPALAGPGPVPEGDANAFNRGQSRGQELASQWRRQLAAWAEDNPGQMIIVGLAAGFLLGKVLRRPRPIDLEND